MSDEALEERVSRMELAMSIGAGYILTSVGTMFLTIDISFTPYPVLEAVGVASVLLGAFLVMVGFKGYLDAGHDGGDGE